MKTSTFILCLCLLLSGHAFSQPKPLDQTKRAQAKEKFLDAEKEYKAGHFGNALEEYYDAFVLSGEPLLLYNVGQCYRNLGRYQEAVEAYQDFLARAPETPFTPKAEKWIAELGSKLPPTPKSQPVIQPTIQPISQPSSQSLTTPSTEPASLSTKTQPATAPAVVLRSEPPRPDVTAIQKDQLRIDLSEEEKGLKKARRMYKLGGAWVGGGLALGGLMLVSINHTKEIQNTLDTPVDEVLRLHRQSIALGVLADASLIVGGVYIEHAFTLFSREKTAQIEFASILGNSEVTVSLSW